MFLNCFKFSGPFPSTACIRIPLYDIGWVFLRMKNLARACDAHYTHQCHALYFNDMPHSDVLFLSKDNTNQVSPIFHSFQYIALANSVFLVAYLVSGHACLKSRNMTNFACLPLEIELPYFTLEPDIQPLRQPTLAVSHQQTPIFPFL